MDGKRKRCAIPCYPLMLCENAALASVTSRRCANSLFFPLRSTVRLKCGSVGQCLSLFTQSTLKP